VTVIAHTATPLARKLAARITQDGPISVADYMQACLHDLEHGYYRRRMAIGGAGDFVTAPEVSSLFSRCLARQVAEVLEVTGGDVLELGAGLGTMAADLLTELAALERLPDRYRILEVSADLAERQRARISRLPPEIAARLTRDLKAILDSDEFAARLVPLGVTASRASPAQFRALIESDTARWAEIVKSVGISVP